MQKIYIKRGDKATIPFEFTDYTDEDNPVPFSLTGYTVMFTVKYLWDNTANDDNAVIKKDQSVHSDAEGGITSIVLGKTETDVDVGEYKADIQIVDSSGNPSSSDDFKVIISNDITKRTS